MEFFEKIEKIGKLGKGIEERAARNVAELAAAIAKAPDQTNLDVTNYISLFNHRLAMAKRAYTKAMQALADDNFQASIEHSERGMLHLQIALIHGTTVNVPVAASDLDNQNFPTGGCEEVITVLGDSICRIKLLVEYKGINLDKNLKARLALIVLNLQDAIENYARADHSTAFDTAISGMTWCQYIYGRLAKDSLIALKSPAKTLKDLYQAACEAVLACSDAVRVDGETGEQINRLETFLQSALDAYLDGDNNDLDKFLRLMAIESAAIKENLDRLRTADLVNDTDEHSGLSRESKNLTFKELTSELSELLDRYHPRPHKSLAALHALNVNIAALRRLIRAEDWAQSRPLLQSCRFEYEIISKQIEKMFESM